MHYTGGTPTKEDKMLTFTTETRTVKGVRKVTARGYGKQATVLAPGSTNDAHAEAAKAMFAKLNVDSRHVNIAAPKVSETVLRWELTPREV